MRRRTFPPYQRKPKQAQEQTAPTIDKGHGRTKLRRLTNTTSWNEHLNGPYVEQVFELEREWAHAQDLLQLIRGHWRIVNRQQDGKDETLGEDHCRIRTGSSPEVLSMPHNVAVHLLEGVEAPSNSAATRRFMIHSDKALPLLFG